MAYPFEQSPTLAEFRKKLETDFKCEFTTEKRIIDDGAATLEIPHIKRVVDGETLTYVFRITDDQERIALSVVASICRRLRIHPGAFGLTLDWAPPESASGRG